MGTSSFALICPGVQCASCIDSSTKKTKRICIEINWWVLDIKAVPYDKKQSENIFYKYEKLNEKESKLFKLFLL